MVLIFVKKYDKQLKPESLVFDYIQILKTPNEIISRTPCVCYYLATVRVTAISCCFQQDRIPACRAGY